MTKAATDDVGHSELQSEQRREKDDDAVDKVGVAGQDGTSAPQATQVTCDAGIGGEDHAEAQDDSEDTATESEGFGEEDDEEEDDDPLSYLPPEQRALIAQRQASLKQKFQTYAEKEHEAKTRDLMTATGITEEEAKLAIECCNNDEIEAAQRVLQEEEFLDTIKQIVSAGGSAGQDRGGVNGGSQDWDSEEDAGEGGEPRKVAIEIRKGFSARRPNAHSVPSGGSRICRKGETGYRLDGEKRIESLRLSDALAKLAMLKKKKKKLASASSSTAAPSIIGGNAEAAAATSRTRSSSSNSSGSKVAARDGAAKANSADSSEKEAKVEQGSNPVVPIVGKENVGANEHKSAEEEDDVEYDAEDLRALKWSEARIKAFLGRRNNPNAYYYRFNAPNEQQATGNWSKDNIKLFMELIKDGVDYRWGLFSMKIPGRVGYQCSNFYRKLIQEGKVHDPNYTVGEDGKLKFQRPKGLKRGGKNVVGCSITGNPLEGSEVRKRTGGGARKPRGPTAKQKAALLRKVMSSSGDLTEATRRSRPKSRRKGKNGGDTVYADDIDSSDGDSDAGTYGYGGARTSSKRRKVAAVASVTKRVVSDQPQLIPGLKCPMTFDPVYDPAISPYGHVMGYDTWMRVLGQKPKDTCPFTKQKLTRRMLVKLTEENLPEYVDQIKEVNTGLNISTKNNKEAKNDGSSSSGSGSSSSCDLAPKSNNENESMDVASHSVTAQ